MDLHTFTATLGVGWNDYDLLQRALTHRSFVNESPEAVYDNERLEFLGDAVLGFLVGDYLFRRFGTMAEGEMTPLRAALVKTRTLADFARGLEFGRFLRLGVGESDSGGDDKSATLCAAFEAVVGAMYLDQGLETTRSFVERLIVPALEEIRRESLHIDAKSEFQVWAQALFNVTPHYVVIADEGPDHDKTFTMQVLIGDAVWGEGRGRSKQKAAQAAAAQALKKAHAADASLAV